MSNDETRDRVVEALRDVAWSCTRVWEAWQYGTMTQDDFAPAWEDDELIDSILVALASVPVSANQTDSSTEAFLADARERAMPGHLALRDEVSTDTKEPIEELLASNAKATSLLSYRMDISDNLRHLLLDLLAVPAATDKRADS